MNAKRITRRRLLASGGMLFLARHGWAARDSDRAFPAPGNSSVEYGGATLPPGIRSRRIDTNNQAVLHILEAGYESPSRPCVVLLHGFPELAYTWRNQMLPLAHAGYHVIAPDARGYGLSAPRPVAYADDLVPYSMFNRVSDVLGLVRALGYREVAMVVGHDWGGPTAQWCACLRPDVFRSVVMMSAPFAGPPALPFNTANSPTAPKHEDPVHRELAALPRPRKHYQWYYSTREANADMHRAPQGVHDFLRAYYHHKSADWKDNKPTPLQSWSAAELAKLPTYYVMDLAKTMAETVAVEMPQAAAIAANRWLPDRELAYYSGEYSRTGFQGGLQWYRCGTSGAFVPEMQTWSGRTIDVPSCFIAGKQDWGTHQRAGVFEAMQTKACTKMIGCHLIDGAGHWVQQEQPVEVRRLLLQFQTQATGRGV